MSWINSIDLLGDDTDGVQPDGATDIAENSVEAKMKSMETTNSKPMETISPVEPQPPRRSSAGSKMGATTTKPEENVWGNTVIEGKHGESMETKRSSVDRTELKNRIMGIGSQSIDPKDGQSRFEKAFDKLTTAQKERDRSEGRVSMLDRVKDVNLAPATDLLSSAFTGAGAALTQAAGDFWETWGTKNKSSSGEGIGSGINTSEEDGSGSTQVKGTPDEYAHVIRESMNNSSSPITPGAGMGRTRKSTRPFGDIVGAMDAHDLISVDDFVNTAGTRPGSPGRENTENEAYARLHKHNPMREEMRAEAAANAKNQPSSSSKPPAGGNVKSPPTGDNALSPGPRNSDATSSPSPDRNPYGLAPTSPNEGGSSAMNSAESSPVQNASQSSASKASSPADPNEKCGTVATEQMKPSKNCPPIRGGSNLGRGVPWSEVKMEAFAREGYQGVVNLLDQDGYSSSASPDTNKGGNDFPAVVNLLDDISLTTSPDMSPASKEGVVVGEGFQNQSANTVDKKRSPTESSPGMEASNLQAAQKISQPTVIAVNPKSTAIPRTNQVTRKPNEYYNDFLDRENTEFPLLASGMNASTHVQQASPTTMDVHQSILNSPPIVVEKEDTTNDYCDNTDVLDAAVEETKKKVEKEAVAAREKGAFDGKSATSKPARRDNTDLLLIREQSDLLSGLDDDDDEEGVMVKKDTTVANYSPKSITSPALSTSWAPGGVVDLVSSLFGKKSPETTQSDPTNALENGRDKTSSSDKSSSNDEEKPDSKDHPKATKNAESGKQTEINESQNHPAEAKDVNAEPGDKSGMDGVTKNESNSGSEQQGGSSSSNSVPQTAIKVSKDMSLRPKKPPGGAWLPAPISPSTDKSVSPKGSPVVAEKKTSTTEEEKSTDKKDVVEMLTVEKDKTKNEAAGENKTSKTSKKSTASEKDPDKSTDSLETKHDEATAGKDHRTALHAEKEQKTDAKDQKTASKDGKDEKGEKKSKKKDEKDRSSSSSIGAPNGSKGTTTTEPKFSDVELLLDDFCEIKGISAKPSTNEMKTFSSEIALYPAEQAVKAIVERLSFNSGDDDWRNRFRVLHGLISVKDSGQSLLFRRIVYQAQSTIRQLGRMEKTKDIAQKVLEARKDSKKDSSSSSLSYESSNDFLKDSELPANGGTLNTGAHTNAARIEQTTNQQPDFLLREVLNSTDVRGANATQNSQQKRAVDEAMNFDLLLGPQVQPTTKPSEETEKISLIEDFAAASQSVSKKSGSCSKSTTNSFGKKRQSVTEKIIQKHVDAASLGSSISPNMISDPGGLGSVGSGTAQNTSPLDLLNLPMQSCDLGKDLFRDDIVTKKAPDTSAKKISNLSNFQESRGFGSPGFASPGLSPGLMSPGPASPGFGSPAFPPPGMGFQQQSTASSSQAPPKLPAPGFDFLADHMKMDSHNSYNASKSTEAPDLLTLQEVPQSNWNALNDLDKSLENVETNKNAKAFNFVSDMFK